MSSRTIEQLPNWESHDVRDLRPFALLKLIVADLDGTVLRSSGSELSETIKSLNRKLSHCKNHVRLTIATGRSVAGVSELLNRLDIRGLPVIVYNGSLVLDFATQQVICKTIITPSAVGRILRIVQEIDGCAFAYVFNGPMEWAIHNDDRREVVIGWKYNSHSYEEFNRMSVDWRTRYESREEISPVAMIVDLSKSNVDPAQLRRDLKCIEQISITGSNKNLIEIRPSGSNKSTALAQLANNLGISRDEILTIGDNDNDCEMLAWAGIGVSVAGASQNAVESSRYTCRHGVVAGVIEILRLVIQSKRYLRVLQSL